MVILHSIKIIPLNLVFVNKSCLQNLRKGGKNILREQRDQIRIGLLKNHLSQVWLIDQLSKRCGVEVDKSTLSAVLNGSRQGNKAQFIIDQSVKILTDYETKMNKADDK